MRYALAFVPHLVAGPLFPPIFDTSPFPHISRGEYVDLTRYGRGLAQVTGTMTSVGPDPVGTGLLCAVTVAVAPANQAAMPFAGGDFVPWPWLTDAPQEAGGHDIGNG